MNYFAMSFKICIEYVLYISSIPKIKNENNHNHIFRNILFLNRQTLCNI